MKETFTNSFTEMSDVELNIWEENAKKVEQEFGGFVDWENEFYICPECGEPICAGEWERHKLIDFICPVCEWEGD